MRHASTLAAVLLACACAAAPAAAQSPSVGPGDTVAKVLAAQTGKRVTLKLGPGDEITGVVKLVTPDVVHLSEIAGREFFDAVIDTRHVVAVIVRVK
jgi:hypothetical protein